MRKILDEIQNDMIFAIVGAAIAQNQLKNGELIIQANNDDDPLTQQFISLINGTVYSSTLTSFFIGVAQKHLYDMCLESTNFSKMEAEKISMLSDMLYDGVGIVLSIDGTCIYFNGIPTHDFSAFQSLEECAESYIDVINPLVINLESLACLSQFAVLSITLNKLQSDLTIMYFLSKYLEAHPNSPYSDAIEERYDVMHNNIETTLAHFEEQDVYRTFAQLSQQIHNDYMDPTYKEFIDFQIRKTNVIFEGVIADVRDEEFEESYNSFLDLLPFDSEEFIRNNFILPDGEMSEEGGDE